MRWWFFSRALGFFLWIDIGGRFFFGLVLRVFLVCFMGCLGGCGGYSVVVGISKAVGGVVAHCGSWVVVRVCVVLLYFFFFKR